MNRLNGFLDSFVDQAGYRQHGGIWSGISRGDTIIQSSGTIAVSGYRNFEVQVFGGSGAFKYRQGNGEGWAVKMAHLNGNAGPFGDGFFPLAISGIYGLDNAYHADPDVFVQSINSGGNGALTFYTDDRKVQFVAGRRNPIVISGVNNIPIIGTAAQNDLGDVAMANHANILQAASFSPPNNVPEASARALGPGLLTVNTGSGIINVSTGSGICMVTLSATQRISFNIDNFVRLPMSTIVFSDYMFNSNTTSSGVQFMAPGLFKVEYHISYQKTALTNLVTLATRAVLKDKGSEGVNTTPLGASTGIPGSLAWSQVTNVTTNPFGTASASFLVNVDPGQFIGFETAVAGTNSNANQIIFANTSGSYCIIQYIGPKRSGF